MAKRYWNPTYIGYILNNSFQDGGGLFPRILKNLGFSFPGRLVVRLLREGHWARTYKHSGQRSLHPFSDPFNVILLREYKGIHGNTREYVGIQGKLYVGIRGNSREYEGIQENTY